MSNNYGSTEKRSGTDQINNLVTRINSNLQNIRSITQTLEDLCSILGGPRDSPSKRDEIHRQEKRATELLTLTKSLFSSCAMIQSSDSSTKLTITKAKTEFERVVQKYSEIQQKIVRKLGQLAEAVRESRLNKTSEFGESTEKLNQSDYLQTQTEEDDQELVLAEETEQRIKELEKNLINVQDMFIEMEKVVVESRPMVDNIEQNVENANADVENATEQLHNAVIYKKSAFKKKVIIIIVIIIILAIIGIIIGVSVRKDSK